MTREIVKGSVSGPDPDGRWHWRPLNEGASQPLAEAHVDPDWVNGKVVLMRVDKTFKGLEVIGPASEPSPTPLDHDDPILVNGEPLHIPPSRALDRGVVVIAEIPFTARDPHNPERKAKKRPAVVVYTDRNFVSLRGVYSQNSGGRGRRLRDPNHAGLNRGSVVDNDEVLVPRDKIRGVVGSLSSADMAIIGHRGRRRHRLR